jgi:hypothetical protein
MHERRADSNGGEASFGTYYSISWSRNCPPSNKQSFITVFIRTLLWSLGPLQSSIPQAFPLASTSVLSSFQRLVLPSCLLYITHSSSPSHLSPVHKFTLEMYGEVYELWSSSLRNFLQPNITPSLSLQIDNAPSPLRGPFLGSNPGLI